MVNFLIAGILVAAVLGGLKAARGFDDNDILD